MNIHEHQAKQILKKYGAVVPKGVFAFTVEDLIEKVKSLKTEKFVLKAQTDFGFLGTYNSNKGNIPFERFYLGGDGMQQYAMDGRETISLMAISRSKDRISSSNLPASIFDRSRMSLIKLKRWVPLE